MCLFIHFFLQHEEGVHPPPPPLPEETIRTAPCIFGADRYNVTTASYDVKIGSTIHFFKPKYLRITGDCTHEAVDTVMEVGLTLCVYVNVCT